MTSLPAGQMAQCELVSKLCHDAMRNVEKWHVLMLQHYADEKNYESYKSLALQLFKGNLYSGELILNLRMSRKPQQHEYVCGSPQH